MSVISTTSVIHILLWITQNQVLANINYVTPNYEVPCPEKNVPCKTLSEYTLISSINVSSSTLVLIMLPGNHSLCTDLDILNVKNLTLLSTNSRGTMVTCNPEAKFKFESIENVKISGLKFIGCANNIISDTVHFSLKDCTMQGDGRNGSAFQLRHINSVTISNSEFCFNTGSINAIHSEFTFEEALLSTEPGGGAIVFANCNNASITNSLFQNNFASYGGALYALKSKLTINNTVFKGNLVKLNGPVYKDLFNLIGSGGAIWARYTNLSVFNCTFTNNSATDYDDKVNTGNSNGGAVGVKYSTVEIVNSAFYDNAVGGVGCGGGIYAYESKLSIHACAFENNSATAGAPISGASVLCAKRLSRVYINDSIFLGNNASWGSSTVGCFSGTIKVRNCTFRSNTGYNNYVVLGTSGSVFIYDSTFANNTGGAVSTTHCFVLIDNGTFIGNGGKYNDGSVYNAYCNMVILVQCKFIENSTPGNGGAASFTRKSTVLMIDAILLNNTAGTGGAISVGENSNCTVRNSTFIGNSATFGGGGMISIDSVLVIENSMFSNNTANIGGALSINNNYNWSKRIYFRNLTFLYNDATSHGAAIYISSCLLVNEGSLVISNNSANSSVFYVLQSTVKLSGNTNMSHNFGSLVAFSSNITLSGNNTFAYNVADQHTGEGGAVTCVQSNFRITGTAVFIYNKAHNGGAISTTECKLETYGTLSVANNRATFGGAIYAYQSELNFESSSYLSENVAKLNGGGLYALGTSIHLLSGALQLKGNNAKQGGGMFLNVNSKVYILKKSSEPECNPHCEIKFLILEFINNSADYGGAMYIADDTYSSICGTNMQSTASECFYQSLALYDSVNVDEHYKYNIINTYFINNSAIIAGATLFGGLFDRCLLSPMSEIFIFAKTFPEYEAFRPGYLDALSFIMKVTNLEEENVNYATISSYPTHLCFCLDGVPQCAYQPPKLLTLKGDVVTITIVVVDHVGNVIPGSIVHSSLSSGNGRFNDGQSLLVTNGSCTDLKYNIFSPDEYETLYLYAEGPCNNTGKSLRYVDVEFLPCICPIGLEQSHTQDTCECDCDTRVRDYVTNCSNGSLIRSGEYWITYINSSYCNGFLIYPHCPFDYCHSPNVPIEIDLTTESGVNNQCAFKRSGMLCGTCEDGLSLTLGSSHCEPCSNVWLLMLVPFFIAGILLVALLLVCNLSVSIGTINGLVFYANIIAANRTIFLPFTNSNFPTVFIAWLNLDFGIQICFFNGLDSYVKTWLQFVFPLYILCLIVAMIFISEYNQRFTSLILRMKPIATFSTLILLSYTKLLRIVITTFSFATLKYPDGSKKTVWLFDAEIDYLKGKHIILFIVALIVLLIGMSYTLVLFIWQWLLKCPDKVLKCRYLSWVRYGKLYSLMDAYNAPYVEKNRYWTGLLLFARVLLYLISSVNVHHDPSVNLLSTICVVGALLLLSKLNGRTYKNWFVETLESSFLFNIIILSAATLYVRDSSKHSQTALAYTSTSIAFITFLVFLVYHIKYESILNKSLRSPSPIIIGDTCTTESDATSESLEACFYTEIDGMPKVLTNESESDNSSVETEDSADETESAGDSVIACITAQNQTSSNWSFPLHNTDCAGSDHEELQLLPIINTANGHNSTANTQTEHSGSSMHENDESDSLFSEDETTPLLHTIT